jgi:dihydrofolate reductase
MQGGTTFTFVTDGIRGALDRALNAAHGKDVQVGGGVSTIRQFLREGLIDELRLAIARVLLGKGEALFEGMNWRTLGYRCEECVAGEKATHVTITKQNG